MKRSENNGKNYKSMLMIVGVVFLCQFFGIAAGSDEGYETAEEFGIKIEPSSDFYSDAGDTSGFESAQEEVVERAPRKKRVRGSGPVFGEKERIKVYRHMEQMEEEFANEIRAIRAEYEEQLANERALRLVVEESLAACLSRAQEVETQTDASGQGAQADVPVAPQEAACDYVEVLRQKQVPAFNLSFNQGQYFKMQEFNVASDRLVFQDQSRVPSNLLDFVVTLLSKATSTVYSESDLSSLCSQDDLRQWLESNFKDILVPQMFYTYSQRDSRSYTGYSNYFVAVKNFLHQYDYQRASAGKQTYSYRAMPTNVASFIITVVEMAD